MGGSSRPRPIRCCPRAAAWRSTIAPTTLLLQDTADRLADVRRLVATLDIPVRQVLIEARSSS